MSTARFAVCVSALTPFAYHSFRVRVTLLPLGEQLAHVDVAHVAPYRAVDQPIDHRVGLHSAAEPAVPFRMRVLRADDRRCRRVAPLNQLEHEADVGIVDVLRQLFVVGHDLADGLVLSIVLRTFNLPSVRQLFLAATRRDTGGSSIPCSRRT